MGGSSSRLGPHHHRRPPKRSLSSFFICGGAPASASENEDGPAELLVNSAENGDLDKFPAPKNDSALSRGTGSGLINCKSDSGVPSQRRVVSSYNCQLGDGSGDAEASIRQKYLSENKELVSPHELISGCPSGETASSSNRDQPYVYPASVSNQRANMDVNGENIPMERDVCTGLIVRGSPSFKELGDSSSAESPNGNHMTEVIAFQNYDSTTASAVSDTPSINHFPGDDTPQEAGPAGIGLVVSGGEQDRREGNRLNVDVVSGSSSVVSSSSSDINNESIRSSRRLFWSAFSRRPRRYTDSQSHLLQNDDSDNLGHRDRWLLDFSGDFLGEGIGGDFRTYGNRAQGNNDSHWHSRTEMLERIHGDLDGSGSQTALCPTGMHHAGSCSCESILRAEQSGPRASISRIVMLAEALFEVLDEIHRQPSSVSLSVVSLPAPDSVVNTFPVKDYRKPERLESDDDDVPKCYICLAEYEEGDTIRVLPCHHEYHVPCIDKWLKEIHGVCPLCRGDVRERFTEGTPSASEISSLQ